MAFKIPFSKKNNDFDDDMGEIGPDNGLSDNFDSPKKPSLKNRLSWISVIAAYILFATSIIATISYLIFNAEDINSETLAKRPSLSVEEFNQKTSNSADAINNVDNKNKAIKIDEKLASNGGIEAKVEEKIEDKEIISNHENKEDEIQENLSIGKEQAEKQTEDFNKKNIDEEIIVDTSGSMLQPHPDPALSEETSFGILPKIGEDGREAWQVYSRPINVLDRRPKISIIVTNLGISDKKTAMALTLSGKISLAFSPYSSKLDDWITKSRNIGHETLLTLPMEPVNFPKNDPGPFALLSTLTDKENIARLEWVLTRTTGYIGLINFMGSRFSSNKILISNIFKALRDRGLAYIDTKEGVLNSTQKVADEMSVANISADIIIDETLSYDSIIENMARLEKIARKKGIAVAIARPYPITIDQLKIWTRSLDEKGFALTPISAVIADKVNARLRKN